MEPWLVYAVITYFLWAVTNIIDKGFLDRTFRSPVTYAVFGGLFQISVLIIIPFVGFSLPPLHLTLMGLLVGAFFLAALLPYFKALSYDDATTVVPLGSLTPVFVLMLSIIFLGEGLTANQGLSFVLFLAGGFLLSVKEFKPGRIRFTPSLKLILLSVFMCAIALVLIKFTFNSVPFLEGFVLLRTGTFLLASCFLISGGFRKRAVTQYRKLNTRSKTIFASNQTLGIASQFFFNLAIAIGIVSLVNAAKGIQYVFLFIISLSLAMFFPRMFHEKTNGAIIARKSIAILLIVLAVYFVNV